VESATGNNDLPGYIRENPRGNSSYHQLCVPAFNTAHFAEVSFFTIHIYKQTSHFNLLTLLLLKFSWNICDILGDDEIYRASSSRSHYCHSAFDSEITWESTCKKCSAEVDQNITHTTLPEKYRRIFFSSAKGMQLSNSELNDALF
jgi:hypothetical protein